MAALLELHGGPERDPTSATLGRLALVWLARARLGTKTEGRAERAHRKGAATQLPSRHRSFLLVLRSNACEMLRRSSPSTSNAPVRAGSSPCPPELPKFSRSRRPTARPNRTSRAPAETPVKCRSRHRTHCAPLPSRRTLGSGSAPGTAEPPAPRAGGWPEG